MWLNTHFFGSWTHPANPPLIRLNRLFQKWGFSETADREQTVIHKYIHVFYSQRSLNKHVSRHVTPPALFSSRKAPSTGAIMQKHKLKEFSETSVTQTCHRTNLWVLRLQVWYFIIYHLKMAPISMSSQRGKVSKANHNNSLTQLRWETDNNPNSLESFHSMLQRCIWSVSDHCHHLMKKRDDQSSLMSFIHIQFILIISDE